MNYYERATQLQSETIAHRRYLHQNAEVGLELPKTVAYVTESLKQIGLEPQPCGHGVMAQLGSGGKTVLLRADMDALPMAERSGLDFACPTGTAAHTCGHDFHAAMLLTAAKMLKEQEAELPGTVRFMFQPAEEPLLGCQDMVDHGILDGVDAAIACHVSPGQMPVGIYLYNNTGTMMFSANGFRLTIHGKGGHGAYPHLTVDPINIGVHIYLALQELIARETDPNHAAVLTIGQFSAGSTNNIIPGEALMQGSLRTNNPDTQTRLLRRIKEVAVKTADVYGGTVEIEILSSVPPLICDSQLVSEVVSYLEELNIPGVKGYPGIAASASEDFAIIAEKVPASFMYLSAGFPDERGAAPAHNPAVLFNEDVCPIGSALLAHSAHRWLQEHR